MARIDTLANFLTDVATAIKDKKGDTTAITPANFDTEITNLPSGSSFKPEYVTFRNFTGTELDDETTTLDTSNITNMYNMFRECTNLTSLDLSKFDTSNVTTMGSMFYNDTALTSVKMPRHINPKLTNCSYMFYGCSVLNSLDISNFNTSNVTNMEYMFNGCNQLTSLDLSSFDTSNVTTVKYMFYNCYNLKHIDMRNFSFSNLKTITQWFISVPTDCEIIVKDDATKTTAQMKIGSSYTNIKTVAEYEAELTS